MGKHILPAADWSSGVRDRKNCTPAMLRRSAVMALERAKEWADTAERLLAKADDLAAFLQPDSSSNPAE